MIGTNPTIVCAVLALIDLEFAWLVVGYDFLEAENYLLFYFIHFSLGNITLAFAKESDVKTNNIRCTSEGRILMQVSTNA